MANMGKKKLARLANASLQYTKKHLISSLKMEKRTSSSNQFRIRGKWCNWETFRVYSFSGLKGFQRDKVISDFSSKLDQPVEDCRDPLEGIPWKMARLGDAHVEGYNHYYPKVICKMCCLIASAKRKEWTNLQLGTHEIREW